MRRVCVFCGSSVGARPEYREAARTLARALTRRGIGLVYGGSRVGVMDLRIVGSMHERKALMAELSDGFIALPGGLGTIEELLEALTWAQLGLHKKPCGLLNVCHYFDALVGFLDHAVDQRFIKPEHLGMLLIEEDSEALLARFGRYHAPSVDKTGWALGLAEGGS